MGDKLKTINRLFDVCYTHRLSLDWLPTQTSFESREDRIVKSVVVGQVSIAKVEMVSLFKKMDNFLIVRTIMSVEAMNTPLDERHLITN